MKLTFQSSKDWANEYRSSVSITDSGDDSPEVREMILISAIVGQMFGPTVMWMDEEGDTFDSDLAEWCNSLPSPPRTVDVLGMDWWRIAIYDREIHPVLGPVIVVQTYLHSHGGGEPSSPNCWAIFPRSVV